MEAGNFYGMRLFTWYNPIRLMEEDFMAMSLLYALLGIHEMDELETIEREHQKYTPVQRQQHPDPKFQDEERAIKYKGLKSKQQREVREALYDALYAIVEGGNVNKDLNMAIGKALCNAISGNHLGSIQGDPDVARLSTVLRPIVVEAIDDIY